MNRIAIHGVPRSGTTWLGSIFDSSEHVAYRNQPLFSYVFKAYLDENSSKNQIINFFNLIAQSEDEYINQIEAKQNNLIPDFKKKNTTHIVYKETRYHYLLKNMLKKDDEMKVVGIVRNPLSVLHSWVNAPKEFRKDLGWDVMEEWRDASKKNTNKKEEYFGFTKWKEIAILFQELKEKYPDRVRIVRYDELLTNTNEIVKKLFSFCRLEMTLATLNFINESSTNEINDAYSVFRANQNNAKWIDNIPTKIISEIESELSGSTLERYI